MKFGKQLQLQLYPPWRDHYVGYTRLKRMIARFDQEKTTGQEQARREARVGSITPPIPGSPRTGPQATEKTPLTGDIQVGRSIGAWRYGRASRLDERSECEAVVLWGSPGVLHGS
jgi:hypothetical protein